jgi:ABC-type Co2+ transport system permease subunit
MVENLYTWFIGLGEAYNVDPIVFGSIYVGAIPLFLLSVTWLVRNHKEKKSTVLPTLAAGSCFVSAYVYLLIVGNNVPLWVYGVIVLLLGYGAYSSIKSIRKKIALNESGL